MPTSIYTYICVFVWRQKSFPTIFIHFLLFSFPHSIRFISLDFICLTLFFLFTLPSTAVGTHAHTHFYVALRLKSEMKAQHFIGFNAFTSKSSPMHISLALFTHTAHYYMHNKFYYYFIYSCVVERCVCAQRVKLA